MTDDLKGLLEVRRQTATIMKQAEKIIGGRDALAKHLGVEPSTVAQWQACETDAPAETVNKAVEVIVGLPFKR
jgi:DNA-binding transcriptional regulator YdaS (Cro superfamily)